MINTTNITDLQSSKTTYVITVRIFQRKNKYILEKRSNTGIIHELYAFLNDL